MNFKNKIILITGGTGSFGSAVVDRFIDLEFKEIRILSRDELKQDLMRHKYNNSKIKFYIGDVRDISSIKESFRGVDYVFHAAALKQVPSCEFFPMEAVKTNIIGSNNIIDAGIANNVKKIIFLSTDKACYPINAMGMSKSLMEKNVIARSRNIDKNPVICCTRYGNVMASRGSVIPLFLEQIYNDKPLTITNPKMTRFMMDLNEAIDLVLHAFEFGEQGDLFIQKSAASTIDDLANALFKITKKNTGKVIIGTRHGEKLYETLATSEEICKAIDMGQYYKIPADNRDLNYDNYFIKGKDNIDIESYNSHNTKRFNEKELIQKLMKLDIIKKYIKD